MGTVKENMTSVLGKLHSKRVNTSTPDGKARTFADAVLEADAKLTELIITKEADVKNERGREEYNQQALATLRTMQFHLNEVCHYAEEYSNLK